MKVRPLLQAVAVGIGLTVVLLTILTRHPPLARANPSIYYVRENAVGDCLSVTTPCSNVQHAINLAVGPGNEVRVAGGTYTENLVITRSVKLQGGWTVSFTVQNPVSTPTILDGGGITHNVRVAGAPLAEITIEDLTLRNGNDGIHVWSGYVTVEHSIIQDMTKQGLEIDGGTVFISATQILTVQQGIEVDDGIVRAMDVRIAHTSGEGLLVERGGTVTFTNSTIEDCLQQGIQVNRGSVWLFDNLIRDIQADGIRVEGGEVAIVDNIVHATLADGLDVSGTHTIDGNLVYDTVKRGIYAHARSSDWNNPRALTLSNNIVHDTGGDGIRADGGLTVTVRDNTIYSAGNDGIDARGGAITILRNKVSNCADDGIQANGNDAHIESNWVLNNGIGIIIRSSAGLVTGTIPVFSITNNMVAGHVTASVELTGTGTGFVAHNTLVGNGLGNGLAVLGPLTVTVVNNIVASHSVGITATAGAALSVSHTLLWANAGDPISGTAALSAPPLFAAPAQQNLHLRADSPAIDAGIETGVFADVDGDPRPLDTFPDIGADEFRIYAVYLPLVMKTWPPPPPPVPSYYVYANPNDLDWLSQDPYRNETIRATFCVPSTPGVGEASSQKSGERNQVFVQPSVALKPGFSSAKPQLIEKMLGEAKCWSVDIRYRGDTARLMPKKSWKIFFSSSDPFQGQMGSAYELNLNADYVDQSLLRSSISYDLLARAGVPAPRASYARLYINGEYYGLFSQVEQVDERFLHRNGFEMHGNLYKPFYGPLGLEANDWWYTYRYPKKTNRQSGHRDLVTFIKVINYTPDDQFADEIAEVMDVNGWLDWYAVNILIGNFEMTNKNYYIYDDFDAGRWMILPWDTDIALGHNEGTPYGLFDREISWDNPIDTGADPTGKYNYLIDRMMRVAEFRFYHCRLLTELMAGEFSPAEMFPRIGATYAYIYDAATTDPNRWRPDLDGDPGFEDGPDELKTYITNRIQFLEGVMPGFCPGLQVPLTINEFMAANSSTITDEAGDADAWVEIYNDSSTLAWDVGGMYLTDVLSEATRWQFPTGTAIPAEGTLLIWADGEQDEGPLHANFVLDASGGQIGLFDRDVFNNGSISVLTYTAQFTGVSYGRMPDGSDTWQFLATPTPGWPNQGRSPIVSGTTHAPTWPTGGEAVTVTTTITDEGSIDATLWYRTFAPGALPPGYQSMPMTAVGGTTWQAILPAQTGSTWVEYYVEAEDEAGMVTVDRPGWPLGDYRYVVGWQRPPLYINELMAINSHTLKDEFGETDDWIELYNAGAVDIDMGGMYLSNNIDSATQFPIPANTIIPAGGYRILWADGDGTGGHLNFKLSGAGEYVGLFDSQAHYYAPIDAVYFPPQTADVSWGRFPDSGGAWLTMTIPTPGSPNRLSPPQFSRVTRAPTWPDAGESVTVTAVITAGTPIVSAIIQYDVGSGFQAISMAAISTTNVSSKTTWQVVLPPQPTGTLVQYYLEAVDDVGQTTRHPSSAPVATHRYLVDYAPPNIVINEFLADNASVNQDEAGEYDDWVELYNAGTVTVTLDGMYLSDALATPGKWQFPAGTSIPPDGHLLVWCDGDTWQGPLHAGFKLGRGGEEIGLFDSLAHGLVPLDWIVFGPQQEDVSYGRLPDGSDGWDFLDPPTPGASNQ